MLLAWLAEVSGTAAGFPFGAYDYIYGFFPTVIGSRNALDSAGLVDDAIAGLGHRLLNRRLLAWAGIRRFQRVGPGP